MLPAYRLLIARLLNGVFTLHKHTRQSIAVAFSLVIVLSSLSGLVPSSAGAAPKFTAQEEAKSYSYYRLLSICVRENMRANIKTALGESSTSPSIGGSGGNTSKNREWFSKHATGIVYPVGNTDCGNVLNEALQIWGWTPTEFLKDMGYTFHENYNGGGSQWRNSEQKGPGLFNQFRDAVSKKVGSVGSYNQLSPAAKYLLSYNALINKGLGQCDASIPSNVNSTIENLAKENKADPESRDYTYTIITVVDGSSTKDQVIRYKSLKDDKLATGQGGVVNTKNSTKGTIFAYQDKDDANVSLKKTCSDLVKDVNSLAAGAAEWNKRNPDLAPELSEIADEEDGINTCAVDSGWFLCPAVEMFASTVDGVYEHIVSLFIRVPPISTDMTDTNVTYNAWKQIRNIANIAFVIAFLVIIYSQLTGAGITNYGIKKMLPRLLIAALLVNVSYWIAAIMVDLSNILGSGLYDLFGDVRHSLNVNGFPGAGWAMVSEFILSGGAIAAVGLGFVTGVLQPGMIVSLLGILAPFLIAALLGVFIAIAVLVIRQALIIIFVIISPLAFVAFLLPNTQKFFTKWRQWFVSLLLLYPVMSILVGGSQIAGIILMSAEGTGTLSKAALFMSGQFVMVAPFFLIPFMIRKYGGAGIDKLAGNLQSKGAKLGGAAGKPLRKIGREDFGRRYDKLKSEGQRMNDPNRTNNFRSRVASRARQYGEWRQRGQYESEHYSDLQKEQSLERIAHDNDYRAAISGQESGEYNDAEQAKALAGLDKIENEQAQAARIVYDREGLSDRNALLMLTEGRKINPDGSESPIDLSASQRIALRQQLAEATNYDQNQAMWDDIRQNRGNYTQNEINAFADSMMKNKGAGIGVGAIQALRTNDPDQQSYKAATRDGLLAGRFSAQAQASADDSDLKAAAELLRDGRQGFIEHNAAKPEGQRLSDEAINQQIDTMYTQVARDGGTALTDGRYGAGKNRSKIEELVRAAGGPPDNEQGEQDTTAEWRNPDTYM